MRPCVDAANSGHFAVNEQVYIVNRLNLLEVALIFAVAVVERFNRIVGSRCVEGFVGGNFNAGATDIGLTPVADIALGTGFLRTDIGVGLLL